MFHTLPLIVILLFNTCNSYIYNFNYFNTKEYQNKNRFTKLDLLWKECQKVKKMFHSFNQKYYWINNIHNHPLRFIYLHKGDSIPFSNKLIHKQGLIAKCKFIPSKVSRKLFTGTFKTSNDGFIRISAAISFEQSNSLHQSLSSGISLKFLRDKVTSSNFLFTGIHQYNQGGKDNIFKFVYESEIDIKDLARFKSLKSAYELNPYLHILGYYDNGKFDKFGNSYQNPKFPYFIKLRSGIKMRKKITYNKKEFIQALTRVKSGNTVFNVYAISDPKSGCEIYLGKIVLKSKFTLSLFADKHYFIYHGNKAFDFNVYPNWIKYSGFVYKFKVYKEKNVGKCTLKFKI